MSSLTETDKIDHKLNRLRHKLEEVQRTKFHQVFSQDERLLYKELLKLKTEIDKLLQTRVINKKQYDLLLPKSKQTDSSKFDGTLVHVLLTNFCGYVRPPSGWHNQPNPQDVSEIADLIRLKKGRNDISHLSQVEKTGIVYKTIYNEVKDPLLRLGCSQQELDHIIPMPVNFKFFPSIPNFTGRDSSLQQIHQELTSQKTSNHLGVVISSLAGVGKSELAKKYFEVYSQTYDDNVAWINAENLETSFQQLGSVLQLKNVKDQHGNFKPIEEIIASVHAYFQEDKVLFIFDNADLRKDTSIQQPVLQEEILKYLPTSKGAFSLITSQVLHWNPHFKVYPLEPLSMEEARTFVKKELNILDECSPVVDEILEKLGCHSLAIQQFTTYVKQTNISVNEYLKLLSEQPNMIFSDKSNVTLSIKINIERVIKEKNLLTLSILNAIRFLNSKDLYREFFLFTKFGSNYKVNEALLLLEKYSLIRLLKTAQGIQDCKEDIIMVHSLVQETVRCIQTNKQTELEEFKCLLERFPLDEEDKNFQLIEKIPFDEFKYWYHQFVYLNGNKGHLKTEFLKKYCRHVLYLTDVSIHTNISLEILEEAESFVQMRLEEEKEEENIMLVRMKELYRIRCCRVLCMSFISKDYQEQIDMLCKLGNDVKLTFGENNIEYLRVQFYYIHLSLTQNDNINIHLYILSSCALSKKVFGESHPISLLCMHNYGRYQFIIRNLDEAVTCFENLIAEMRNIYEEPHRVMNMVKHSYAKAIFFKGDYERSLVLFKELLTSNLKIYQDKNNWNILATKNSIARNMQKLGDNESALEMYKEILLGYKKIFHDKHAYIAYIETEISDLCELLRIRNLNSAAEI